MAWDALGSTDLERYLSDMNIIRHDGPDDS